MIHKAVLVGELIENLNLESGDTVVDGTLGAGGHSSEVLKKILPGGSLISIDWDGSAVERFRSLLIEKGIAVSANEERIRGNPAPTPKSNFCDNESSGCECLSLGHGGRTVGHWCGVSDNYANLSEIMRGQKEADAIFADLGFSSDQIEDSGRGFSFLGNGPLDMRYSPQAGGRTAAQILSHYSEQRLTEIFRKYGEEKYARGIAREIAKTRKTGEIGQTEELAEIIARAVPESYKRRRIHFATKIFQALRIETNRELENLKIFLSAAVDNLSSGGRLAIISFHSLEDRIVKDFFRAEAKDCICPPAFPKCICDHRRRLKIITKKPIVPGAEENAGNPRARSAKLRVAEKL